MPQPVHWGGSTGPFSCRGWRLLASDAAGMGLAKGSAGKRASAQARMIVESIVGVSVVELG